ncbi:MAG: RNA polymerase-binding protein DksA, partial [Rhizobiaceae bacterium]
MTAKTKEYKPSDDEEFMNPKQQAYFKDKLQAWRFDIQRESAETVESLQEHNLNAPDLADRATSESDRSIELRARDRQRKLVSKINQALKRIEDGEYGFCEETGEPISLQRLDAR